MSDIDFEEFDVISYLEDSDIYYAEEGKNVTEGWANIHCPFPFCSDPSEHLGINLDSKCFHCWACGESGTPPKLIRELEGCSWAEAYFRVEEYLKPPTRARHADDTGLSPNSMIPNPQKYDIIPVEAFSTNWPDLHTSYLRYRNFNPKEIIEKYQLKYCHTTGKYKFRILIPVIMNGEIVNFTSRDVTNQADNKYKTCPNKEAVIPLNRTLYNIDSVNKIMVIVEGPIDVWRIGDGAVGLYGTVYTNDQIWLIKSKAPKIVYIMLDSSASEEAKRLGNQIASIIDKVEIRELIQGDPADLTDKQVKEFRQEIGLN